MLFFPALLSRLLPSSRCGCPCITGRWASRSGASCRPFCSVSGRVSASLRFAFSRCPALIKLFLTRRVEMMERSGRDGVNGERSGTGAWGRGEGMRREAAREREGVGTGAGRRGLRRLGQADDVGPAGGVVGASELVFDGVGKEGGLAGGGAAGKLLGAEDDGFGAVGAVDAVQGAV